MAGGLDHNKVLIQRDEVAMRRKEGGDVRDTADIYLWECLHTEPDGLRLARALPLSMYSQILGQH